MVNPNTAWHQKYLRCCYLTVFEVCLLSLGFKMAMVAKGWSFTTA